ncbi:MAG: DUF6273 domain-containing protein, partial [Bacillota bacterium]
MKNKGFVLLIILTLLFSSFQNFFVFKINAAGNISIGQYLVIGNYYSTPILWRCVDIDENGPLMLSNQIITIKAFDAKGTHDYSDSSYQLDNSSSSRTSMGSNLWETSNMRMWLNSTADYGKINWIDNCPPNYFNVNSPGINDYDSERGFLANGNFTANERNVMKNVSQKSIINTIDKPKLNLSGTVEHAINNIVADSVQNYDTAYFQNVSDTMFLLDVKQNYKVYYNGAILGDDYYIGTVTKKALDNLDNDMWNSPQLWPGDKFTSWLRSPLTSSDKTQFVRKVLSSGNLSSEVAYRSYMGVRPAFYLNTLTIKYSGGDGSLYYPYYCDDTVPIRITPTPTPKVSSSPTPGSAVTATPSMSPTPNVSSSPTPGPVVTATPSMSPTPSPVRVKGVALNKTTATLRIPATLQLVA